MTSKAEDDMDKNKQQRLKDAGWKIGSAAEFLELSPEEAEYVELKVALSSTLKERRSDSGLSQGALAKKLGSSQSRVAKMEASDPTVSVDLLIRGLLAVGASKRDIASAIAGDKSKRTRRATSRSNTR
jgi:ribosome-binding protein aMBF1 (putative translation factor)